MIPNKFKDTFTNALVIVARECATITPPNFFASICSPEYAVIYELMCYASYLAKIDGKISKDEVNALKDLLSEAATRINKISMKIMADLDYADVDRIPFALDEIISRDNIRLLHGERTVPVCIYLWALYEWTSQIIKRADGFKSTSEEDLSDFVIMKILDKISIRLNLPEAEIEQIEDDIFRSIF